MTFKRALLFFVAMAFFFCPGALMAAGKPGLQPIPQGEVSPLSLSLPSQGNAGGWTARFLGREFMLQPDKSGKLKGLIAAERDAKPGSYKLEIFASLPEGEKLVHSETLKVVSRKFVEQHLKVDQKMVTLSKEDEERAAREREIISRALCLRSGGVFEGDYLRPVEGEVSSTFGLRRFYNGKAANYHGGLDIAAPRGEPVKAAGTGKVALAGDFFYTGKTVFIDHGLGLITGYFHLDEIVAEEGKTLSKGEVVGKVGSTGRSTGPHLHWSVYVAGLKVDPLSLLKIKGFQF